MYTIKSLCSFSLVWEVGLEEKFMETTPQRDWNYSKCKISLSVGASAVFFKFIPLTDPHKYKGGDVLSPLLAKVLAGIWNHDKIPKKQMRREMMLKSEGSTFSPTKTNASSEMLQSGQASWLRKRVLNEKKWLRLAFNRPQAQRAHRGTLKAWGLSLKEED